VIGPEPPLGSEHNSAQSVENARICKMVAVSGDVSPLRRTPMDVYGRL
jgi:hypothetical protein